MTTTVAEAIKYAIAHGLKTVNLSPANGPVQDPLGPASGRLPLRLRTARAPALAFGEQRLLASPIGSGYPSKLLQRLSTIRRIWN